MPPTPVLLPNLYWYSSLLQDLVHLRNSEVAVQLLIVKELVVVATVTKPATNLEIVVLTFWR